MTFSNEEKREYLSSLLKLKHALGGGEARIEKTTRSR